MYRDQLSHEAKLIVQGRQEIIRDAARLWNRVLIRLGIKAA